MDNEKLNELLVNVWDSLTDEQKEKAKACKTPDEFMKLAGEEGIELPDEVLDAVAGGFVHLRCVTDPGSGALLYYEWEVIRDSDGAKIGFTRNKDSEIAFADAQKEAAARGFSTDYIDDTRLGELRKAADSGC